MSKFSSLMKMGLFHGKDMLKKARKNPERLFLGAMDKVGTGLWNNVLGTNWKTPMNLFGGPSDTQFRAAERSGIDTGPARAADKVARTVISMYAAPVAAGLAGKGLTAAKGLSGSAKGTTGGKGINWMRMAGNVLQGQGQGMAQPPPSRNAISLWQQPLDDEQRRAQLQAQALRMYSPNLTSRVG